MSTNDPEAAQVVTCPSCGRGVPEGEFCGACGAHLALDRGPVARRYRYHAFAANPAEHVLQSSVISTLFPHLPHRRTAPFRLALWLWRGQVRRLGAAGWATSLPSAVAVAVVVDVILGLSDTLADSLAYAFGVRVVVAAVLLLLVRVAIHHMLLAEAVTAQIGPAVPCSHCHRVVPRMAFCPCCGVAIRATPKCGQGRTARAVR